MSGEARLRIAPSPTGEPHVGTAYSALFNRCYAKSKGGKFILRIEDTDRERSTKESEEAILESLRWLGLTWDEGPDLGGSCGPYRQSERARTYSEHAALLLEKGWGYKCFCTKDDLDAIRSRQMAEKRPQVGYFASDSPCRKLTPVEIKKKEESGIPSVIRLKVPAENPGEEVGFYENIRQKQISIKYSEIDDQILLKSDGFPTYHLANVVDDHLMGISVVMRGEEWIPSTFKHVLLYRAFGWEQPLFYNLSLLRNADKTKSKISKRRNPVSLNWFRAAGYLPAALLNFLALMGYSRDTAGKSEEEIRNIELFTLDELTREFDPSRISVTGPAFDYDKLNRINEYYIQKMSPGEFERYLCDRSAYLVRYLGELLPHVQERFRPLEKNLGYWTDFLFRLNLDYGQTDRSPKKAKRMPDQQIEPSLERYGKFAWIIDQTKGSAKKISDDLSEVRKKFKDSSDTYKRASDFEKVILELRPQGSAESKILHMSLRIALLGSMESLPLYESMSALGVYRCINRLDDATAFLKSCKE